MDKYLELHVGSGAIDSSVIPIRWCLTPAGRVAAQQKMVGMPENELWLFVVVSFGPDKQYRDLYPFHNLMAYVPFYHAGECKVFATMVFGKGKVLRNRLFSRHNHGEGSWETTTLNYAGEEWTATSPSLNRLLQDEGTHYRRDLDEQKDIAVLALDIPKECFAPEPPAWEKRWVNRFFRHKAEDQCDYRRRRLFAYLVQPWMYLCLTIPYLAIVLSRSVVALFLFLGFGVYNFDMRQFGDVSFESPFLPLRVTESNDWFRSPFFRKGKPWWYACFAPAILCLEGGVLFYIGKGLVKLFNSSYLYGVLLGLGMSVISILIWFLFGKWILYRKEPGKPMVPDFLQKWVVVLTTWIDKALASPKFTEASVEEYVCPATVVAPSGVEPLPKGTRGQITIQSIPKKHRTIRLRFEHVKAQVCRPFSRG